MRFTKSILSLFIVLSLYNTNALAENQKRSPLKSKARMPAQTKKVQKPVATKKNFAQQNYREIHLGLSHGADKFEMDVSGTKTNLRSQLQGLSLGYSIYKPGKNTKWLYNYGVIGTIGVAKVAPTSTDSTFSDYFVKNKVWVAGSLILGADYRHSYRARIGGFIPLTFRALDFGFDDPARILNTDPFSFGIGLRYINSVSIRDSVAFSMTHQTTWGMTIWELTWQRRLGI